MELEQKTILSLLPPRPAESNKGHYGKLLVAAGSRRFRGAAQLCALGGLRIGAGISPPPMRQTNPTRSQSRVFGRLISFTELSSGALCLAMLKV